MSITDMNSAVGLLKEGMQLLRKEYEMVQEGAQLQRLEDSFQSLAETAGASGDEILSALNDAARGTVANSDLILSANRAMMLGLGSDSEKLSNLLEVAAFRGRAMGLSTTEAFNDIVTGVGRASPMILDNLGIIIDSENVYKQYAESIGKSVKELTDQEKTQALLNAVIEEGNTQIEKAGGLTDDAAASYERLNAQSKNFLDEYKKAVSDSMVESADNISFLIEKFLGLDDAFEKIAKGGEKVNRVMTGIRTLGFSELGRWLTGKWQGLDEAADQLSTASQNASDDIEDLGDAADETAPSLEDLEEAEKRAADAAKELSRMYTGLLSSMFSIQSENERAAESEQNIANKRAELAEKEKRVKLELWSLRQQEGYTLAEEAKYYQKLTDIQQEKIELDNMEVKAQENAAEASKKRIYDLVQQKLAADGLIESGEFDYLQELAVSYGLVSRESANRAIADNALADQMVSNFVKVQNPMDKSLSTMQQINAFDGRFVNFGINFQSNLPSLESIVPGFYGTSYGGPTGISARAEGGSVSAGTPYLVGERGPEMFIPSQSGQIVSNDAMGKNVNISISVASIRSPSDMDYLAQEVARRVAKV